MNFKKYLREQLNKLPDIGIRPGDVVVDPSVFKEPRVPDIGPDVDDYNLPTDSPIGDTVGGGPLLPGKPDDKLPWEGDPLYEWQDCVDAKCSNCPPGTVDGCYIWIGPSLPEYPQNPPKWHPQWQHRPDGWWVWVEGGCGADGTYGVDGCWMPAQYTDDDGVTWRWDTSCDCYRLWIWIGPGPDGIPGTDDDIFGYSEEDTPPVPSDFPPNYLVILVINGQTVYMVYNPACQCYQNLVFNPNCNCWETCDGYGPQCYQYPGNVDGPILPIPPPTG